MTKNYLIEPKYITPIEWQNRLTKNSQTNEFNSVPLNLPRSKNNFDYYINLLLLLAQKRNFSIKKSTLFDYYQANFKWLTISSSLNDNIKIELYPSDSITIGIITLNNAKTIELVINSILKITDEIIVVDGGSTDGTIDILKKYNIKIKQKVWNNDFSIQRNNLIKYVKTDWLFFIDSDEVLSPNFNKSLKKIIWYANQTNHDIIWLPRFWMKTKNLVYTGHWLFEPDPQARLFRMIKKPFYIGDLHEMVSTSVNSRGLYVGWDNSAIFHLKNLSLSENSRIKEIVVRNKKDKFGVHNLQLIPEKWKEISLKECPINLEFELL